MQQADIVVVGAGLSGLRVADLLREHNVDALVLEARDRVGGRTLSREHEGAVFEHGAQWVSRYQTRVMSLVSELGLTTFPQRHEGTKVVDLAGSISTYEGRIPSLSWLTLIQTELGLRRLDRMARTVPLEDPMQTRRAAEWDATTLETARSRLIRSADGRRMFDLAVRTVLGAEPAELSLLYFLFYINAAGGFERLIDIPNGAQEHRLVEGTQALSTRLAARLGPTQVRLQSPVRVITQLDDAVVCTTDDDVIRCRYVVIATPPHLAGRIRFDPALPPERDQLLQRWAMGATTKAVAFYPSAGWRERGFSGEVVSSGSPLACVFDNSSADGQVASLLAFIVGDEARRWSRRSAVERRNTVLRELERLLGEPASSATGYVEQDWTTEPWTGGCPASTLPTGGLGAFSTTWRAPFARIHWAGTETARYWNGYLEGALDSAERASAEILTRLKGTNP